MKVIKYGVELDLSFEHKTQCPRCHKDGRDKSNDNLHVYGLDENGKHLGCHCFSCNYTIPSEEWVEENRPITVEDMEYELVGSLFDKDVHDGIKSITSFNSKLYRGITPETSKFFGVRYECSQETGEVVNSYYPITKGVLDGVAVADAITGYKVRKHPKGFHAIGSVGKDSDLFGAFRFTSHTGILVLVGGELCTLSAYQMLKQDYDKKGNKQYDEISVVSGVTGEGGIANIKHNYEFFAKHKRIIVMMDNDEAGRIAAKAVAEVLPRGKVYIATLRQKDSNDYLTKGLQQEFVRDMWNAKPYCPDGVYASASLFDAAIEYATVGKLSLPPVLHKVEQMLGKIVTGEVVVCFGDTSIGKSLFSDAMVDHWIMNEPEHTVGVLSLEADKSKYATNLMARHLGVNLNKMEGGERVEYLQRPEVKEKVMKFLVKDTGESRFYVYDNRGTSIEQVKESMLEMVKKLSITILVVDPISDLYMHLSREQQDEFVGWLKGLTLEFPYLTVLAVAHSRKRDIGSQITEQDIIGSSILAKSAAQTFSVERNKLEECPIKRNTTTITVQKNRHGQTTGIASRIYFNPEDGTLNEFEDFKFNNPHLFMEEDL